MTHYHKPGIEVIAINESETSALLDLSVSGYIRDEHRKIEGKRWLIIALFALVGCLQGLVWITFTASPHAVKDCYDWADLAIDPDEQISLLLNWGPIMYLVTVPVVMLVVVRGGPGVWWMVLCGALFTFAGSLIRLIPTIIGGTFKRTMSALFLLHLGQLLNGISGPMLNATVSAVSAAWFPQNERTLATSLAYGASVLGPALGFLFAFLASTPRRLEALMIAECAVAAASVVFWYLSPKLPVEAPSVSAEEKRRPGAPFKSSLKSLGNETLACFQNRSFLLVALSGGFLSGVFNNWSGTIANSLGDSLGEGLSQWLGFTANISNLVGNNIVGPISERWFKLRFKRLILILYAVQMVGYFVFTLSLPLGSLAPTPLIPIPAKLLLIILCVASACLGAATPLFYELGAEMTYPSDEIVTGGIVSGINNAAGFFFLLVIPYIDKSWDSTIMALTVVFATVLMFLSKENYRRTALDIHAAEDSTTNSARKEVY